MSKMKKLTAGTVEAYERAEEVSYQAALQMERDNVQITADMSPEEVISTMMPYYMRQYQETDQEQA